MNNSEKINRIYIFSGSGAGSTTLGANIAKSRKIVHFDSDMYLWEAEIPPFGNLRDPIERNSLLSNDLRSDSSWVLSGSICGWGDFSISFFDVVIFLYVPQKERIRRYISRYTRNFGNKILSPEHPLHKRFASFKDWASSYDECTYDGQKHCKSVHERWIEKLSCPVILIEGIYTKEETLNLALEEVNILDS